MTGMKTGSVFLVLVLAGAFLVLWLSGLPTALAPLTNPAPVYHADRRPVGRAAGDVAGEVPAPAPRAPAPPGAEVAPDAPSYPNVIVVGDQILYVSPEAWAHIIAAHGTWAANILLALHSGACRPVLYLPCGLLSLAEGVKAYFSCPGMHDAYGRPRNGIVPVRFDGLNVRWAVMSAYYGQDAYLHNTLLRDGCLPLGLAEAAWLGEELTNDDR